MTVFAIDSDVLITIQKARMVEPLIALGKLPVLITDVVWDELTIGAADRPVRQDTREEAEHLLTAIADQPMVIAPDSDEARTFEALRKSLVAADRGEHSIIAAALHNVDIVPVLCDRRALQRAVEELRNRPLLSIHGLLGVLRDKFGLARKDAEIISKFFCRKNTPIRPPLWW